MSNKAKREAGNGSIQIRTLEDLIKLNLETINGVVNETIDNRKASLIFTGSRTVTSSMKLGIEALKLGLKSIGGIGMKDATLLEELKKE
jgi:endonuclease III